MPARARECEGKSRDFLADGVARFVGCVGHWLGLFLSYHLLLLFGLSLAEPIWPSFLGRLSRPKFSRQSTEIAELSRFLFFFFPSL